MDLPEATWQTSSRLTPLSPAAYIVAADAYATTLFGMTGADIGYIQASAGMGLGTMDLASIDIREINLG